MNPPESPTTPPATPPPGRRLYVPAIGPRLRLLLQVVLGLAAVLGANSAYLGAVTFLEWLHSPTLYQNYFYQVMFGLHLLLGFLLVVPLVVFGCIHITHARNRPNRRAVRVGYALFAASLAVLVTGIALTRIDLFQFKNIGLRNPELRTVAYWAHVLIPLACVWLYILHRLAGPRIRWNIGLRWGLAVAVVVVAMVGLHSAHPQKSQTASAEGSRYFEPSAAQTASGNFIPAHTLMMDDYCKKCHEDVYTGWFHSAHRFSSFNNPFYLFSVKETREVSLARDGNVRASRWCAGCHDPVPFFSGAFDNPHFDMTNHPTAQAGITCTSCHAITSIDSPIGNGDYTIDEPIHYPFAYSTNRLLQWVNNQLVKAKPAFHNKTFLKPFMHSEEFCGACHKVHIPKEVNHYKEFLRGQNHYDTFLLSGVGHGARSFYYPERAESGCNGCHMPLQPSADFGADFFNPTNTSQRHIHSHLFPSANTALPHLRGESSVIAQHEQFGTNSVRVDVFGLREGGTIDGPLHAPLRPSVPTLQPGQTYLLEVVLRTLRLGHPFTQGTVDSNEVWVEVLGQSGNRTFAQSGQRGPHGEVDPWSHFVNVYMLDRDGNRIDRRNPQDIFTPLYNNQIPPGAGFVVHYSFTVPPDLTEPATFEVRLNYRKFDTLYYHYVFAPGHTPDRPFHLTNDLPIRIISRDSITFPIAGLTHPSPTPSTSPIPEWQRWNDYGIGLLNKGDKGSEKGELVQATYAFEQVERLGRADGPLNLARVFFKEGRLTEAVEALQRASTPDRFHPPAPRWTVAWLSGLVNKQNGFLDQAINEFTSILEDRYPELDRRGFDFSKDYEVINELGQTLFERAKMERGPARRETRENFLRQAIHRFQQTLAIDPENVPAHYNLALLHAQLGENEDAQRHRDLHERYRVDDNARDRAVTLARLRDPAGDHAAQAIVIYSLQRQER